MTRTGHVIRYLAFGLMAAFVTLGGLFAAGYAFEDPGGWAAVGLVALWLVPVAVLSFVAFAWPSVAVWVLAGSSILVVANYVWFAVDTAGYRAFMDETGPVLGLSLVVLLLPLAVLGLRRAFAAGLMLVGLAVATYAAFVTSVSDEPWRGLADSLTTSSTVACAPAFVVGLLFLLAALLGRLGGPTPAVPEPPAPSSVEPDRTGHETTV